MDKERKTKTNNPSEQVLTGPNSPNLQVKMHQIKKQLVEFLIDAKAVITGDDLWDGGKQ